MLNISRGLSKFNKMQKVNRRRRGGGRGTGDKLHARRSYCRPLLLVLCLLAWPLLCSTSPSDHLVSTFARNPTFSDTVQREAPTSSNARPNVDELQYEQSGDRNHGQYQYHQPEKKPDHPYVEYSWGLNQINPWLSACDLAGPDPEDLRGNCGPVDISKHCPTPCKNTKTSRSRREAIERAGFGDAKTRTTSRTRRGSGNEEKAGVRTDQCFLYLDESHKKNICRSGDSRKIRFEHLRKLRLQHCCEHVVVNALAPGKDGPLEDVLDGGWRCETALEKLLLVDAMAARLHCEFEEIMRRFDCRQTYSVVHTCSHCREAYRKWMCSSLVPHFAHESEPTPVEIAKGSWASSRLRPCRSFCYAVEQRCPYLLPTDRAPALSTQYAGEPTFLCGDPEIPETGEQAAKSVMASPGECCYYSCTEDDPAAGLCANCTEPWKHGKIHDPPTAPHCNIDSAQPTDGPVSQASNTSTNTSTSSTLATPTTTVDQDTLFCGNGRIGRVNVSSPCPRSSPSSIICFYIMLIFLLV